MYARRYNVQDPLRARRRQSSRLLRKKRHGERLIQQPQLSLLTLLIIGISEDPAIEQRSVHICDHRSDVARAVGRAPVRGVLDAVEILDNWFVEVHRVALVERIDLAA